MILFGVIELAGSMVDGDDSFFFIMVSIELVDKDLRKATSKKHPNTWKQSMLTGICLGNVEPIIKMKNLSCLMSLEHAIVLVSSR